MDNTHNDLCVGIDLGTTNSVLAVINVKLNGELVSKVVDIPRAVDIYSMAAQEAKLSTQKRSVLPSCVYYREENRYEPLVGDFAKRQYPLRPHLVAKSIKSQMGEPRVEGLSPAVPDKTPAAVSANILKHLLVQAGKIYRTKIEDAVITVPASFDPIMCKATRDAAALAGIRVTNSDGSERPVLLSEPNAVLYDLINQIQNGEISKHILDLSSPKKVLVFDLGGGTLDVTMHEVKRRERHSEVLKVTEIAANRYTRLGGDDFDERLANAMYSRYLRQYAKYPDVTLKLSKEKQAVMPQLRAYAEQLKIDVSERHNNDNDSAGWGDGWEDDESVFYVGGNMGGVGYAYDDAFTQEEVEEVLRPLLGEQLTFDDYRRLDELSGSDTQNIIYPILDVLAKAAQKLGQHEVAVDAVVLNGGMSKCYLVQQRLQQFFGLEPIMALDPDLAVARGAAVYHHYLHKYEALKDDMRQLGVPGDIDPAQHRQTAGATAVNGGSGRIRRVSTAPAPAIEWGRAILNDSLYLGVKNDGVHQLIPTGCELPYQSPLQTGFQLLPGQREVLIPIKRQDIDGEYRTIAQGRLSFKKPYLDGAYVTFKVAMNDSKVITMTAWTSADREGQTILEQGTAEIIIGASQPDKANAPQGPILDPAVVLKSLHGRCQAVDQGAKQGRNVSAKAITSECKAICRAGNPWDFADPILEMLLPRHEYRFKERLFIIARRIGVYWTQEQRDRLAASIMRHLENTLAGIKETGFKVSSNTQAILALSICGSEEDMARLAPIRNLRRYKVSCLYAHSRTHTAQEWVYEVFLNDCDKLTQGQKNDLANSVYTLGVALRKNQPYQSEVNERQVLEAICSIVRTGLLKSHHLVNCMLALGWIGDQRASVAGRLPREVVADALTLVEELPQLYGDGYPAGCERSRQVAAKMLSGDDLSQDEEDFLLLKLEIEA